MAESRALHLFWREHIPRPESELEIFDEHGNFVGRVDFAWLDLGVFAEIDGKSKYLHLRQEGEGPRGLPASAKRDARNRSVC